MQNSEHQAANANSAFSVDGSLVRDGPVLLIDDIVDSRWTLTVCGARLRSAGSGLVFPFALASAAAEREASGDRTPDCGCGSDRTVLFVPWAAGWKRVAAARVARVERLGGADPGDICWFAGRLAGRSATDLERDLEIDSATAERLASLLSRGASFGIELEALNARGIWICTRIDPDYPLRLRSRLRSAAPPVLFGCGEISLLERGGVAVVGSRDAGQSALDVAAAVARGAARAGLPVVSGAARGIDSHAMNVAIDAGGMAIGVVADALDRLSTRRGVRQPIEDGQVVLVTSRHPSARFSVGAAMNRNRLIYCTADAAVVAHSAPEKGGTRAGALEALKARWVPVWASLDGDATEVEGNADLVEARRTPASS